MTDLELDLIVADATPPHARRAEALSLDHLAADLHGAIVRGGATAAPSARSRRPGRRTALAGALAGAAVLAAVAVVGAGRLGDGAPSAWGATVLHAAEASPRLLIDESGWSITRADQFGVDFGETEFSNGGETVQLNWYPRSSRPIEAPHPGSGTTAGPPTILEGSPVVIARYDDSDRYRASWHRGDWTLELDGEAASATRFTAIVHTLRAVGVDQWLGAMPASTVRPDGRAAAVDAMLADIPLPPGFDVARLRAGAGLVKERYQLGAEVTGAVACAWIGRWVDARASGDSATVAQAVAAMATSHRWAILQEMKVPGDYPEVLWELVDKMAGNDDIAAGAPGLTVAEGYRDSLGCDTL